MPTNKSVFMNHNTDLITSPINDFDASPINVVPHNLFPHGMNEDSPPFDISLQGNERQGPRLGGFTRMLSEGVPNNEHCFVFHTPNGTQFWIPNVTSEIKPVVGSVFYSWEEVIDMYKLYVENSGFSYRKRQTKTKNGVVIYKYLRCNKASKPQRKLKYDMLSESSLKLRQSSFSVTDCKANVLLKVGGEMSCFKLVKFVEAHNHPLVEPFNRDLTKITRRLPFSSQQFIHKMSFNKIGPLVAHRCFVSMKGGHHNVNGTPADFKNFAQSNRLYIGDRDSQLVIDRLHDRKEGLPNFYYDFVVDGGKLKSLFWANEISRLSYEVFGEVIAFDATYHTNKYNMIFVPFTRVGHHKQCVTFGEGLIDSEIVDSYTWLLRSFLKAHVKQPKLVLTDQDPAMRQAITIVFNECRHRLCMWHIMKKIPLKISGDVLRNSEFKALLHRLVWNVYIKPSTFESRWYALLEQFNLKDHEWLNDMFNIREEWVPAFFRDIPFSCLMKTTSRCESSNSTFKVNSSNANTLVQFMLCYDTRIDNQRYRQITAEYKTSCASFKDFSELPIEKHAFDTYTNTIYEEVKNEILKGKLSCYISNTVQETSGVVYNVTHLDKLNNEAHIFTVKLLANEEDVSCSCNNFMHIGYLCRHIFCVYRVKRVDKIPSQYACQRWKRDVLPKRIFSIENRYGVDNSETTVLRNKITENIFSCVDVLRSDSEALSELVEHIRDIKFKILNKSSVIEEVPVQDVVEELVGQSLDVEVTCNNPDGIRNKGFGKRRRLSGSIKKSSQKVSKNPRLFCTCFQYVTDHDSRNCPLKNQDDDVGGEEAQGST